jgi:hypothetical protein
MKRRKKHRATLQGFILIFNDLPPRTQSTHSACTRASTQIANTQIRRDRLAIGPGPAGE